VHVVLLNVPVELLLKVTVPVGAIAPAPDESATVAVQVADTPEFTEAGLHETVVVDERIVDARVNVPLLPVWTELPP
jgi:hypothetical protein